jgi:hypothetical protein
MTRFFTRLFGTRTVARPASRTSLRIEALETRETPSGFISQIGHCLPHLVSQAESSLAAHFGHGQVATSLNIVNVLTH